jgi:hypothetical protein
MKFSLVIQTLLKKNLASSSKFFERTATDNCLDFVIMLLKKNIFSKIKGLDRF